MAANVTVTPDGATFDRHPFATQRVRFTVKNSGNDTGTFALTTTCVGAALITSSCQILDQAPRLLAAGDSVFVPVMFQTQARGATASVVLRAVLSADTTVRDSGTAGVFVLFTPNIVPESTTLRPTSSAVTDTFQITNTASNTRTYNFTPECSWQGTPISCTAAPTSGSVPAGATRVVRVSYTTGAGLGESGRILLRGVQSNAAVFRDSGLIVVATRAKPTFTPSGGVLRGITPLQPATVPIEVRHGGAATQTIALAVGCSGAAIPSASCGVSPSSLVVPPGQGSTAVVTFNAGATATAGLITLVGTVGGSSIKDSVSLQVLTQSLQVSVSPAASARERGPGQIAQRDTFVVTNTGQDADEYRVSASCEGAVFTAGSCALDQPLALAPGASAPVWVEYGTGPAGTQGALRLVVTSRTDSLTSTASATLAVSVPPPVIVRGVQLSGAATPQLGPIGSGAIYFDFLNVGNGIQDLYFLRTGCSGGPIVSGSCRVSPFVSSEQDSVAFFGVPGTHVPWGITLQAVSNPNFGQVWLRAQNAFDPAVRDSAQVSFLSGNGVRVSHNLTPSRRSRTRPVSATVTDTFKLQNLGSATESYTTGTTCSSNVVLGACTVTTSPSPLQLAPLQTGTVYLTYTTQSTPARGTLSLNVANSLYTNVLDLGSIDLAVSRNPNAAVAVSPDNAYRYRAPSSAGLVDTFVVTNRGPALDSVALSLTCAAPVSPGSCAAVPSGVLSLPAGASRYVVVMYNTAATPAAGTMRLSATSLSAPTVSDEGSVTVSTIAGTTKVVVVSPDGAARTRSVGSAAVRDTFLVTNAGAADASYNLSASCTAFPNIFTACTLVGTTPRAIARGTTAQVLVEYSTSSTIVGPGTVELLATDAATPSVFDAGTVRVSNVRPLTIAVDVTPDSATRTRRTSLASASDTLWVRNAGSATETVQLAVSCMAPVASCSITPSGSIVLNAGEVRSVVATYATLATPGTGNLVVTATSAGNPTIADRGAIWVTTTTSGTVTVAVTPKSAPRTRPTTAQLVDTFLVSNTGSSDDWYSLRHACSTPPVLAQQCARSVVGPLFLRAGTAANVLIAYTTQGAAASGTLSLVATSQLDPAVADSGSYLLTTQAPASTVIAVAPKSGQQLGRPVGQLDSAQFDISNSGNTAGAVSPVVQCVGAGIVTGSCVLTVGGNFTVPAAPAAGVTRYVRYQRGPTGGTTARISFIATLVGNSAVSDTGHVDVSTTGSATAVSVTPDDSVLVNVSPQTPLAAAFTIRNTSAGTGSFNWTAQCTLASPACTASDTTPTLGPNQIHVVNRSFQVNVPGDSGRITLLASVRGNPSVVDSGRYTARSTGQPSVVLHLAERNPGTTVPREQCLLVALGDAASECGALRFAHALPVTRTLGTVRAPVLLYNSQLAHPSPVITVDVDRAAGAVGTFDSLVAELRVRGVPKYRKALSPGVLNSAGYGRFHLSYDALADTTGVYPIAVSVESWRAGHPMDVAQATLTTAVVNRSASRFGPGWWMAGVERLVRVSAAGDSILWIGGDGSTRLYTVPDTTHRVYRAESVSAPDSLVRDVGAGTYWRSIKGGTRVVFQAGSLLHTATINRLGHTTVMRYDTAAGVPRLIAVDVPSSGSPLTYSLRYSSPSTWLDSVVAPAPAAHARTVRLTHDGAGRVTALVGPDGLRDSLLYHATQTRLVQAHLNRRGVRRTFAYDSAWRVQSDSVALGAGTFARWTIRNAGAVGLALPGGTQTPLADTLEVYTKLDGPRLPSDVADTTPIWLNRFGAPTRVRNALGFETVVTRSQSLPGLVTEVREPTGRLMTASYSTRGNPEVLIDYGRCAGVQCATTRVQWDERWDLPARVVRPMGDFDSTSYDPTNGNVTSVSDGRAGSAVTFLYYTAAGAKTGLLWRVIQPGGATEEVDHDPVTLNPYRSTTPLGYSSDTLYDGVGRDTMSVVPVDSADVGTALVTATRRTARRVYDAMDRVTTEEQVGPPRTFLYPATPFPVAFSAVAETLRTTTLFDRNGNDTTVTRVGTSPVAPLSPLVMRFRYDSLDRRIEEVASDLRTEYYGYDPAGNRISWLTRVGEEVVSRYDALNRLATRIEPAVFRSPWNVGVGWIFPFYSQGGLSIPGDTATFGYDAGGRMISADNTTARIRRAYDLDGSLRFDTLFIRNMWTSDFTTHAYGLEHKYDLNGRRTVLRHPRSIAAPYGSTVADSVVYGYHPLSGALQTVTNPFGTVARYDYDLRDRLVLLDRATTLDSSFYDHDDRVVHRREYLTGTKVRDDTLTYDADGRVRRASGVVEIGRQGYSGLGTLIGHHRTSLPVGNITTQEQLTTDAFGNIRLRVANSILGTSGGTERMGYTYAPTSGRLLSSTDSNNVSAGTVAAFDDAGSRTRYVEAGAGLTERQWAAYDGAQRLRLVDRRRCGIACSGVNFRGAYEEYAYDALGRRVWLRSRRDHWCAGSLTSGRCLGAVQRTVWDDQQVLAEIRYPGNSYELPDSMERDTSTLQPINRDPCIINCPPPTDTSPSYAQFYGRVLYTHGLGIDAPLWMTRVGYYSQGANSVTVTPLVNWRAQYDTGASSLPIQAWPGYWTEARLLDRERDVEMPHWVGSLVEQGRDGTGQLYRRNRYYDPGTGRFTQEDPIGLAGGLNLYGYANGDPVNFSDPFGLCPDCILDAAAVIAGVVDIARNGATAGRLASLAVDVAGAVVPGLPSPGGVRLLGRLGGAAHRAVVADRVADISRRGLEPVAEFMVKTPGGEKTRRFVDVAARDPKTGQVVEMYQVGRQTKSGVPVVRERRALDDIERASGRRPTFDPYNKPQ